MFSLLKTAVKSSFANIEGSEKKLETEKFFAEIAYSYHFEMLIRS